MKYAIIFDVDGTLLNTETIYMRAWVEAAALHGFTMPDEALRKTRAVNAKKAEEVFRSYCGPDFSYETVRVDRVRIAEEWIESCPRDTLLMPFAEETLRWAKEQGYAVAAASSTGYEKTVEHLRHAKLLSYFDAIVGGDMVEKGKPAPDIFLKAAGLAGAQPQNCVVVGDTPADVFAAHAAGIRMILVPDQVKPNEETTPLCYKILSDLSFLPGADIF